MPVAPIDRRRLLQSSAAFAATLPFAWPELARAAEAELIARRVLFDNPDYGNVTVSPDGWHLSWLAPVDGVRNLFVARIDDLASARAVTRVTDRNIGPFYRWAQTNSHIIFFQDRDGDENWRASSVNIRNNAIVPLSPAQGADACWPRSIADPRPTCCSGTTGATSAISTSTGSTYRRARASFCSRTRNMRPS